MTAINSTAEVTIHEYKNKEFKLKRMSFPASMDGFKEVREYLGITTKVVNSGISGDFPYHMQIYSGEWNPNEATKEYAVELDLFGDSGALIICPTFIDLMHLFNELKGYSALNNDVTVSEILDRVEQYQPSIDKIKNDIDLMRSEIHLDIERIGNLIEVGIGNKIKEYIDDGVDRIVSTMGETVVAR